MLPGSIRRLVEPRQWSRMVPNWLNSLQCLWYSSNMQSHPHPISAKVICASTFDIYDNRYYTSKNHYVELYVKHSSRPNNSSSNGHCSHKETQLVSLTSKLSSSYHFIVRPEKQTYCSCSNTCETVSITTVFPCTVNLFPQLCSTVAAIHFHNSRYCTCAKLVVYSLLV